MKNLCFKALLLAIIAMGVSFYGSAQQKVSKIKEKSEQKDSKNEVKKADKLKDKDKQSQAGHKRDVETAEVKSDREIQEVENDQEDIDINIGEDIAEQIEQEIDIAINEVMDVDIDIDEEMNIDVDNEINAELEDIDIDIETHINEELLHHFDLREFDRSEEFENLKEPEDAQKKRYGLKKIDFKTAEKASDQNKKSDLKKKP